MVLNIEVRGLEVTVKSFVGGQWSWISWLSFTNYFTTPRRYNKVIVLHCYATKQLPTNLPPKEPAECWISTNENDSSLLKISLFTPKYSALCPLFGFLFAVLFRGLRIFYTNRETVGNERLCSTPWLLMEQWGFYSSQRPHN